MRNGIKLLGRSAQSGSFATGDKAEIRNELKARMEKYLDQARLAGEEHRKLLGSVTDKAMRQGARIKS